MCPLFLLVPTLELFFVDVGSAPNIAVLGYNKNEQSSDNCSPVFCWALILGSRMFRVLASLSEKLRECVVLSFKWFLVPSACCLCSTPQLVVFDSFVLL